MLYRWLQTAVLALVVVSCPAVAHANLLADPGFESGTAWMPWGNAAPEPWAARTGATGLAFYGWTTGGGAFQDVLASGASNYTFSIYGYRDIDFTVGGVVLKLEFFNAATGKVSELWGSVPTSQSTNSWTLYSVTGTSPTGTVRVRAVLAFSGLVSGGAFKWDDGTLTSSTSTTGNPIHYVSPSGSDTFPYTNWSTAARSIQSAVSVAEAGDTVLVADGTYTLLSQVFVDRGITILGTNAGAAVVNGANTCRGFYVTDPNTVIQGLTITNCRSAMVNSNNCGGGVYFVNGGTIRDCTVVGNVATGTAPNGGYGYARGGGIYCAVTGRIENCRVVGNSAIGGESSGGGIYCVGSVVVTNCDVTRNLARGGIQWFYYGQGGLGGGAVALNGARIEACRISNNVTEAQSSMYAGGSIGSGVYCASATVSRCVIAGNVGISGNYASRGDSFAAGAGAYLGNGGRLENCLVVNNVATGIYMYADAFGGGVYAYGSAEVVNCTIAGNRIHPGQGADNYAGGGLYATYGPVIRNTIVHGNTGGYRGYDNWYTYNNVTMSYCCTIPGASGTGNIGADPRLADVAAGNAHLLADSPCIDRGDGADEAAPSVDIEGNARPLDGNSDGFACADIGAYEAAAGTTTPNLLVNGTFENPSAWVVLDDVREEPWAARNGTNGLAMYGWTDGGITWQDVPAVGTSNYTFTAWGFRDADFPAGLSVEMKLEFLAAGFLPLATTQRFVTGSAAWSDFSIGAISPPDTEIVRVVLAFAGPAGAGGAFKWDDAVLLSSAANFNARYVSPGGGHVHPFTNWAGASTNLQAAIDAADAADTILVSNGTYQGETVVNKPLSIRGVGDVRLTGKSAYPLENQVRALCVYTGCLLDLRNVKVMSGYSQRGGGILNYGTLVLKDSTIVSNEANLINGCGGGIYNAGTAMLERCSIVANEAQGEGTPSAGTGYGAGIYCANGSVLVVTDSALVRNRAFGTGNYNGREGGSGYGGAIYNDGGTVTLIGTTLATNSAVGAWGGYNGGHGYGGGIYTRGLVTLRSCTLADNRAQQGGATMGGPYLGEGGAIYLENGAPVVNFDNSLIARNTASTAGPDVRGTLNASGRNLLGSIADCATIGATADVMVGLDVVITGLGDHGGPTPTCVPLHGSPAIDAGNSNNVPAFDQRGVARPIDGNYDGQARVDIGACEYDPQTTDSDGDSIFDYAEVITYHSNPSKADSDDDGMGDGAETRAGTNPTNSASLFDIESQGSADWNGEGIVVRWQSVGGKQYEILRSTNIASGFTSIASHISATEPVNATTDTTATAEGPYFYKIRVE